MVVRSPGSTSAFQHRYPSMEISGNRINPYPLPAPERQDGGRVSPGNRYTDEKNAAESNGASTGGAGEGAGGLSEFVSRGEVIQGPDYAEILQRARLAQAYGADPANAGGNRETLAAQKALSAYQTHAEPLENSGTELLPRIDAYA